MGWIKGNVISHRSSVVGKLCVLSLLLPLKLAFVSTFYKLWMLFLYLLYHEGQTLLYKKEKDFLHYEKGNQVNTSLDLSTFSMSIVLFKGLQQATSIHRCSGTYWRDHRGLLEDDLAERLRQSCHAHQSLWRMQGPLTLYLVLLLNYSSYT